MALLGFEFDLKKTLTIVVILMIISFGLGYYIGSNNESKPIKKGLDWKQ